MLAKRARRQRPASGHGYPRYNPAEVEEQWRSFQRDRPEKITSATLFSEARRLGWNAVSAEDFDDIEESDKVLDAIDELNQRFAVVRPGGSTAIVDKRENGDIEFLTNTGFRELFANRKFEGKPLGSAWISHPERRTYHEGVDFDPSGRAGPGYLNLYHGLAVEPRPDAPFDLIHGHVVQILAQQAIGDSATRLLARTKIADDILANERRDRNALDETRSKRD